MGTPSWRGSPAFSWKANSPFSSSCLACLVLQTGLLWSLGAPRALRGMQPGVLTPAGVH